MRTRWWTRLVVVLALVLTASAAWHFTEFLVPHPWLHVLADVCLFGGSALAMLYGAYWHLTNPMPAERYPRIFGWVVLGGLFFVGMGVAVLFLGSRVVEPAELLEAGHLTGSVGPAVGLFVGSTEARAITTTQSAARSRARTEALRAEKARIERLNDLMRHYILNGTNIIVGHAEGLKSAVTDADEQSLETIIERAETMATLVEHIRAFTAVEQEETIDRPVSLMAALDSAARDLPAGTRISLPAWHGTVRANETLDETFSLLFDALDAVIDDGGAITVECVRADDAPKLAFTAMPAELPGHVEKSLFEPIGAGVGLELYLASTLLAPYADLTLARNDGDAVRFELDFESTGK